MIWIALGLIVFIVNSKLLNLMAWVLICIPLILVVTVDKVAYVTVWYSLAYGRIIVEQNFLIYHEILNTILMIIFHFLTSISVLKLMILQLVLNLILAIINLYYLIFCLFLYVAISFSNCYKYFLLISCEFLIIFTLIS